MAPRTALLLSVLLTVTACQMPAGLAPEPQEGANEPKRPRRPAPSPGQSEAKLMPSAEATGEGAASGPAYDMLLAPASGHLAVDGSIAIDAEYLLSTGRGKLIGQAGGNLIGQAGGNLIGQAGGNIIAAGGGNLIGQAGGNLIGQAGGNLIGQAGGNLIGQAGGNMIAERKYRALAGSVLALGEVLKASEMEIRVFSMATCQQLPLGVDKDGRAIMSIYSNLTGDFRFYLPESLKDQNVRIEATVPEAEGSRFTYNLAARVGSDQAREIDEDTALVTAYLREAFVSRLERLFMQTEDGVSTSGTAGPLPGFEDILPDKLRPLAEPIAKRFTAAAKAIDAKNLPPAERRKRARQTADALLAHIDLDVVKVRSGGKHVVEDLVALMAEVRKAAIARMAAHAQEAGPGHERDYFSHESFLALANSQLAEEQQALAQVLGRELTESEKRPPYEILRPSDLGKFALDHIFSNYKRDRFNQIEDLFQSIGMESELNRARLNDAMDGLLFTVAGKMLTDAAVVDAAIGAIHCGE